MKNLKSRKIKDLSDKIKKSIIVQQKYKDINKIQKLVYKREYCT